MLKSLLIFITLFSFFSTNCIQLKKGDIAPKFFSCLSDDGKKHNLTDYKGKKVVIYFYPKDGTPWCTQEAKGFRDNFELFQKNNIEIIGISYDSVKNHRRFKRKYNLPFTLLSDPESKIISLYNAQGLILNKRITYLINENGKIIEIFSNVNPKTHAQDILRYLGIIK